MEARRLGLKSKLLQGYLALLHLWVRLASGAVVRRPVAARHGALAPLLMRRLLRPLEQGKRRGVLQAAALAAAAVTAVLLHIAAVPQLLLPPRRWRAARMGRRRGRPRFIFYKLL